MLENASEVSAAHDEQSLVEQVKSELREIDSSDLSEHSHRFEALHEKLAGALNAIDGL